ncbi:hypothetical protein [Defluviitalea raffinosedens]|uniref:hypothetical protein n=1 Tax=Defluviitalea raffinosedens TaxID=1450156 RepID=UPI0019593FF0|nr:hypothetical protein [Defluviitalea raffinosedens]MBM7685884.1 hypothetical protein [Defluviitalea raffinosedens]
MKYSATVTADHTDLNILEKEITIPNLIGEFDVTFSHIKDAVYQINLSSKSKIAKAVIQYENPQNGNWLRLNSIKNDNKFIMDLVDYDESNEFYTYQKTLTFTTTGKREFRILILDSKNEVIEKSYSLCVDVEKLISFI